VHPELSLPVGFVAARIRTVVAIGPLSGFFEGQFKPPSTCETRPIVFLAIHGERKLEPQRAEERTGDDADTGMRIAKLWQIDQAGLCVLEQLPINDCRCGVSGRE